MKQYKAVFIDWDQTIGDFWNAAKLAQQDIFVKYDLQRFYPSAEAFYEVYHPHNLMLWDLYGEDKITKPYLQHDRFYWPLTQSPHYKKEDDAEIQAMADLIAADFEELTTQHFALLPHSAEVVRYLASKYPLTVVSNGFVSVQYRKIKASGLQDCFAHIVLSEEVGVNKPQPEIYEYALRINGVNAEDVIMIGDTYASDIQGAINAGIDQIWIQSPTLTEQEKQKPATYKLNNLLELKQLL